MKTLMFTSPTCGPCRQMKMDLAATGIGSEITPVDVSRPENADLMATYGVRSVPTMVFLDDDEEIIKVRVGYTGNVRDLKELFA